VATVFVMALTGALVSGTRAGFAYNSFPWMDGALVPPQLLQLSPWYRNFLDNLATVQFVHRAMACVVLATMVGCWWRMRWRMQPLGARALRASNAMLLALALQLGLGIATLLSVVALPLAAAHQAGAVLLFAATLWNAFALCQAEDAARG
jgi:cytochrome c oxidase assembly protein subunit 15